MSLKARVGSIPSRGTQGNREDEKRRLSVGIKEFLIRNSDNFVDAGMAGAFGLGTSLGLKGAGIDVDPNVIFEETIKMGVAIKGGRIIIDNVGSWRPGQK